MYSNCIMLNDEHRIQYKCMTVKQVNMMWCVTHCPYLLYTDIEYGRQNIHYLLVFNIKQIICIVFMFFLLLRGEGILCISWLYVLNFKIKLSYVCIISSFVIILIDPVYITSITNNDCIYSKILLMFAKHIIKLNKSLCQ